MTEKDEIHSLTVTDLGGFIYDFTCPVCGRRYTWDLKTQKRPQVINLGNQLARHSGSVGLPGAELTINADRLPPYTETQEYRDWLDGK